MARPGLVTVLVGSHPTPSAPKDQSRDRSRTESDRDVQAAVRLGARGEGSAVRGGDGVDDGEAEAVPAGVVDPAAVELLERLADAVHLAGWDDRARVPSPV